MPATEPLITISVRMNPDMIVHSVKGLVLLPGKDFTYTAKIDFKWDEDGFFDVGKAAAEALQGFCDALGPAAAYCAEGLPEAYEDACAYIRNEVLEKPGEYSYDPKVFSKIRSMKDIITHVATELDVPAIAIAGSIADEYDARWAKDDIQDFFLGLEITHKASDLFRDSELARALKLIPQLKPYIIKAEQISTNDIGIGNINLGDIMSYMKNNDHLLKALDIDINYKDAAEVINFLLTEEGTAKLAGLYIKIAQNKLIKELSSSAISLPSDDKIMCGFLITMYKQGIDKYLRKVRAKTIRLHISDDKIWQERCDHPNFGALSWPLNGEVITIQAGEGLRVLHQWEAFEEIFPGDI